MSTSSLFLFTLITLMTIVSAALPAPGLRGNGADGTRYVGNFGISATDALLANVSVNPPVFGQYLTNAGSGTLGITVDGVIIELATMTLNISVATFPELSFTASHPILQGLGVQFQVNTEAWKLLFSFYFSVLA